MTIQQHIQKYAILDNLLEGLDNSIDSLTVHKKDLVAQMAEIKKTLLLDMQQSDLKKAVILGWKLNLSERSTTVIEEEDSIPQHFWKTTQVVNLTLVRDAIKKGIPVEGAVIVTNKSLTLSKVPPKKMEEEESEGDFEPF